MMLVLQLLFLLAFTLSVSLASMDKPKDASLTDQTKQPGKKRKAKFKMVKYDAPAPLANQVNADGTTTHYNQQFRITGALLKSRFFLLQQKRNQEQGKIKKKDDNASIFWLSQKQNSTTKTSHDGVKFRGLHGNKQSTNRSVGAPGVNESDDGFSGNSEEADSIELMEQMHQGNKAKRPKWSAKQRN